MKRVFLGGTFNESTWRQDLIPLLKIDYFDPVVSDWTEASKAEELKQRVAADYVLYVISPEMTGLYSIAEVVDDSNKRPKSTLFCVIAYNKDYTKQFTKAQLRSLDAVKAMVTANGATVFNTLKEVAEFLNRDTNKPASTKW